VSRDALPRLTPMLARVGGDPAIYYRTISAAPFRFSDAMREAGVGKIVFSYDLRDLRQLPTAYRSVKLRRSFPSNPYGETSWRSSGVRWYGEAYGLRSVSCGYFNAAGADLTAKIGELHQPENPSRTARAQGRSGGAGANRHLRHRLSDLGRDRRSVTTFMSSDLAEAHWAPRSIWADRGGKAQR